MPFASSSRPSLGLSLLKAALTRQGLPCDVLYLHLRFAERLGTRSYDGIADSTAEALVGEWIFADDLFGERVAAADRFFASVLPEGVDLSARIDEFLAARALVGPFLEECESAVDWEQYALVGFTSMFQQNVASLALARRLKDAHPQLKIIFGGANCEGPMGEAVHRLFPFVDFVCSGEGDLAFPVLAARVVRGAEPGEIPGIIRRDTNGHTLAPAVQVAPVLDLDSLPEPDFDDFVEQRSQVALDDTPGLCALIETSRGCWWGQKSHCTFCGLNGQTMQFRVKSPERALAEFTSLTQRYQPEVIEAVDNILDMRYFREVLPRLVEAPLGPRLFYETKANLRRDQVRLLREAGVQQIQPGIESLNSNVLRIMRKGVSALQNIQLLRWCAEYMIEPGWNIIAGFPGEDPDDYARQAEIVPLLTHLVPPLGVAPLRLDRFSPLFNAAAENGLCNLRSGRAYELIYPFARSDLSDLAYYFEFDYVDGRDPNTYIVDLRREVESWREAAPHSDLISLGVGDDLVIWDTRPVAQQREYRLRGSRRAVYERCDIAQSAAELRDIGDSSEVTRALADFVDARLMLYEDGRYLSLAVAGEYRLRFLRRSLEQGRSLPIRTPPLLVHLATRLQSQPAAAR
jgi:ribosomal peptide maturation radical SAM protein 1